MRRLVVNEKGATRGWVKFALSVTAGITITSVAGAFAWARAADQALAGLKQTERAIHDIAASVHRLDARVHDAEQMVSDNASQLLSIQRSGIISTREFEARFNEQSKRLDRMEAKLDILILRETSRDID